MLNDRLPKHVALSVTCPEDCFARFGALKVGDRVRLNVEPDDGLRGAVISIAGRRYWVEWDIGQLPASAFNRDELLSLP